MVCGIMMAPRVRQTRSLHKSREKFIMKAERKRQNNSAENQKSAVLER